MGRRLNVAVVGLGVGEQHFHAFNQHPHSEVIAVCDLSQEKLDRYRERYPYIRVTRIFEELLEIPSLDIVAVASFDDDHYQQVLAALGANKHVFVEKPICQTIVQAKQIKSVWEAGGGSIKLMSNLILRSAPLYIWLKEQIKSGTFGRIYAFDGDYLYGRLHKITGGWRKDVPDYSVMTGGGIHLIDLFLWITGEKPISVMTVGNKICTERSEFKYNDYMAAVMQTPGGLIARVTANFGCIHRHHHVMRIFGTEATFMYDDQGPRMHFTTDPHASAACLRLDPLPGSKGDLIPGFVDAVLCDLDISPDTQSVFDSFSLCYASDNSIKTGRSMTVEYL